MNKSEHAIDLFFVILKMVVIDSVWLVHGHPTSRLKQLSLLVLQIVGAALEPAFPAVEMQRTGSEPAPELPRSKGRPLRDST